MNCKEFEKLIPEFIEQTLDFPTMKKCREHILQCNECNEELTIQFLVIEGMQRLEEGDAFDLQSELKQCLDETDRKVRFHMHFLRLGAILEIIAVILIAGGVIWLLS